MNASRVDIESEKERTPRGYGGRGREVTMQMQEYIYLGTTPMYFLGASGCIVRGESNSHTPGGNHRAPLSFYPVSLSPCSHGVVSFPTRPLSLSLFSLSRFVVLSLLLSRRARVCHHPEPIPRRFMGKLVRSPGLIDRQVMGQFNLISKINNHRRRRWSIYSEIPRAYRDTEHRGRRRSVNPCGRSSRKETR